MLTGWTAVARSRTNSGRPDAVQDLSPTSAPLVIIPCRAGSSRVPRKNLRLLHGQAPWGRARDVSLQAFDGATIVVTGDWWQGDLDMGGVQYRRRPDALATDTASMVDVVLDVLARYPGDLNQRVLLVQPTQPLRRAEHLRQAYALLETYPSVASVTQTISIGKLYRRVDDRLVPLGAGVERDQDPAAVATYACDGTVYGFRRGWFLSHRTFRQPGETYGMVIPAEDTCRLDTPHDWLVASLLLAHREKV